MYVCLCKGVVENQIKDLIAEGIACVHELQKACHAGSDCGACLPTIRKMIAEKGGDSIRNRGSSNSGT